jgi:hypothetical protein
MIKLNTVVIPKKFHKKPTGLISLPKAKDLESGATQELTEMQKQFRIDRNREVSNKEAVTTSRHFLCVCFGTQERRDAFLSASGWSGEHSTFVDGEALAKSMGIELPTLPRLAPKTVRKVMKRVPMIRELPEPTE